MHDNVVLMHFKSIKKSWQTCSSFNAVEWRKCCRSHCVLTGKQIKDEMKPHISLASVNRAGANTA